MNDLRYRFPVLTMLLLTLLMKAQLLMAQRAANNPPTPAAFDCTSSSSRPLSLTIVISLLEDVALGKMSLPCIEERIRLQGVSFELLPIVEETLRGFAASQGIINRIPIPKPPPIVAPKVAGPLTVACSSPECEVYIGGVHQTTNGGTTEIRDLTPGKLPLVVYKAGFIPFTNDIDLVDGVRQTLPTIKLQPIPTDPSIPALKVKELLWDMAAATGHIESIGGNGTLSWITDDKTLEWQIPKFAKTSVNGLDITFKSAGDCKLKITGDAAKPATCARFIKKEPKADVVAAAKLFLKYQVHDILGLLSRRKIVSSDGIANALKTDGGPDSYTLTVGADGLPSELVHQFQDRQWTVQYKEYEVYGNGKYPKKIVIEDSAGEGKWEFQMIPVAPR